MDGGDGGGECAAPVRVRERRHFVPRLGHRPAVTLAREEGDVGGVPTVRGPEGLLDPSREVAESGAGVRADDDAGVVGRR